jgi:hypothetical protein
MRNKDLNTFRVQKNRQPATPIDLLSSGPNARTSSRLYPKLCNVSKPVTELYNLIRSPPFSNIPDLALMSNDYLHHKYSNIYTVHFKQILLVSMKELIFRTLHKRARTKKRTGWVGTADQGRR